jgi:cytoskeletal protein CcmA (bactofilin family)
MANRQVTVLNPAGYQELLQTADTLVVEGDVNMNSNLIGGLPAPVSDNDAARKKYIDDAIANVNLDLQGVTDNGSTTTNSISVAGGTFSGSVNAAGATFTGTVATPNHADVDAAITNRALLTGATFTGDVKVGDDDYIKLGDSDELSLVHNNTGSSLLVSTTTLTTRGTELYFQEEGDSNKEWIHCLPNGQVELSCDGLKKLETDASGVDVTGQLDVSGQVNVTGEGFFANNDIYLRQLSAGVGQVIVDYATYDQAIVGGDQAFYINDLSTTPSHSNLTIDWDGNITSFGNGNAIKIDAGAGANTLFSISYPYAGSVGNYDGIIENTSPGDVYIRGKELHIQDNANSNQDWIHCVASAGVELHYDGDKAFETDAEGLSVYSNYSTIPGLAGRINFGTSNNCRIEIYDNNAANSAINNNTFKIYSQHGANNTTKTSILYDGFFDQVWRTSGSASGPSAELGRVNYDGGWELNYHDIQGSQGDSWAGTTCIKKLETTSGGVDVTGDLGVSGDVTVSGEVTADSFDIASLPVLPPIP